MSESTNNKKKELIIWHEFDGPGDTSIEVLEEICRLYSERNDINVTTEVMNIKVMGERIGEVHRGGPSPHIAFAPSDMVGYSDIGNLSKVPSDQYAGLLSERVLSTMTIGNELYGVPILNGNHLVLYYNNELFPQAPLTWADIEEAAPALLSQGVTPIAADLAQSYWFIPFFTAFGGWPMKDGMPSIGEPAMKEALAFVKEQIGQGTLASLDGSNGLIEQFIDGKIGAIICGEWIFNHLDKHLQEKLSICRLPRLNAGQALTFSSSIGFMYPGGSLESEMREDILDFTNFVLSEECQLMWANKVQRIPADEKVLQQLIATSSSNKAEIISQLQFSQPMPNDRSVIHVWLSIAEGLQLLPNHSVDDAFNAMNKKLEESLQNAQLA
ncbi:extracellular solute-binding protein family 1 [Paenibacillus curdlanolyticus YK9]|uniref:Extracellular solute-binding protein family 1 n=1 Tax=Paenibacillus curdlanolyticus YK9 TaxID=717606 RepID=E0IC02_9BACL|nr:extracellular solute-binding protein [Paenibacillus curdlanolyticus]EFM10232.1 extracellular solute-binding protein family 1 [Paenibacillus curdlanolyticus YK9]